jgi:hypothetical protein
MSSVNKHSEVEREEAIPEENAGAIANNHSEVESEESIPEATAEEIAEATAEEIAEAEAAAGAAEYIEEKPTPSN